MQRLFYRYPRVRATFCLGGVVGATDAAPVILSGTCSAKSKNPVKGTEAFSFRFALSSVRHQLWALGLHAPLAALAGHCARSFQLSYALASLAGSRSAVTSHPRAHGWCRLAASPIGTVSEACLLITVLVYFSRKR